MRRLATLGFVIAAAALTAAGQSQGLIITTTSLPPAVFGQPYAPVDLNLTTSGDPGPFTWSFVPGSNPPSGFVVGSNPSSNTQGTFCFGFNGQNGAANCSGYVQTQTGTYSIVVKVISLFAQQTASQQYTFQVLQPLLFVTKSTLPTATANTPYSAQLQTTGGTTGQDGAQFAWSVVAGSLPAGIALDPNTGLLSGRVSNAAVPSTFTVQVTDLQASVSATRQFSIDVQGGIAITTTSLPNATLFEPYSFQFGAANAAGLVWSVAASTPLPVPFTLSSGGLLTGTGIFTGKYDFTVLLTDPQGSGQPTTSKPFTLYVTLGPLSIKEATLPGATQNAPYQATLTAVGGLPPYAWSFDVPNPQGLKIDAKTGAISGTPPAAGTFTIPVSLRDAAGGLFSQPFTLNVGPAGPALSITTTSLPNGSVNVPYSATPVATGGATPYKVWAVTAGTLPSGLSLNAANGQITGTPTTEGTFPFTVQVTDAVNNTATKAFTIVISQALVIITSSLPDGTVLTAYSQTVTATGGTPPYIWSSSGLPTGLQLNSTTGAITGTPGVAGTSQVVFTVTDVNSLTGTRTIPITIRQPPPPTTTIGVSTATQPAVSLTTSAPYASAITGVITLTFASSPGGTDGGEARFVNGTRSLQFTVPATTEVATFTGTPAIITGTVAGTITLTATMSAGGQDITPSPAPTKTIVIDSNVPVITSVALQPVTGGINVVVTGYSNTREVSGGSFTFTVSSGNKLSQAQITVQLTSAFGTWFSNAASNATGGQFKLNVPFSVTQGSATAITGVSVTLTNSKGASAPVSSSP